jgi:hypothetical protein
MIRARLATALGLAAFALFACSGDGTTDGGDRTLGGNGAVAGFSNAAGTGAAGAQAGMGFAGFGNQPVSGASGGIVGFAGTGDLKPKTCAEGMVNAARTQPVITLVIDGSGSMCESFGGPSRWNALRDALLNPMTGLITQLEAGVQFGLHLYDGGVDGFLALLSPSVPPTPECALTGGLGRAGDCLTMRVTVPNALNNFAAIDAVYPQRELGGSTPTDLAMREVLEPMVNNLPVQAPDGPRIQPHFVILATDGQPNSICYGGLAGDGVPQQNDVVAVVEWAAQSGVKTYVISLAQDPTLMTHLDAVAQAGGTGSPPFTPTNQADLVATLTEIIGGAIGCRVELNGAIMQGQECSGAVSFNGFPLECNSDNGWRLVDERTIELTGTACTDFINSPASNVTADFPCGVFVPD